MSKKEEVLKEALEVERSTNLGFSLGILVLIALSLLRNTKAYGFTSILFLALSFNFFSKYGYKKNKSYLLTSIMSLIISIGNLVLHFI